MGSIKNFHDVSATYFFVLAFLYVLAGLMFRNQLWPDIALTFIRFMDVPLAMIGLSYGCSTVYLQMNEGRETVSLWSVAVIAFAIILFGLVVFVNFAFPSRI